MIILGIETSCDDTCSALVKISAGKVSVLKNIVSSQANLHKKYGGVVPEMAARAHIESIIPIISETVGNKKTKIDAIAITTGPGLITSLHVGVETAKTISLAWKIPIIKTNHIEGHIYSCALEKNYNQIKYPAMALVASGGHTELIAIKNPGKYSLVGRTRDDAAGEAFDKSAKMLSLPYPGGPEISKRALTGDPKAFEIPRPMIKDGFEFSFSGMKNAIRLLIEKEKAKSKKISKKTTDNICASVEQAIVDVLVEKSIKAIEKFKPKTFIIGGGVSANKKIRLEIQNRFPKNIKIMFPDEKYCSDNAAMIAAGAYFKAKDKKFNKIEKITADANWELV